MGKLKLETMVLGMVQTNCYLAKNTETGELLIVDPPEQAGRIADRISRMEGRPSAILLTHGHFDHIGAAEELAKRYAVPIAAMKQEQVILEDPENNLSALYGRGFTVHANELIEDGEERTLAGFRIQVLLTPGHTAGGCCYYLPEEKVLFSGDTLFRCSVGRTDFPTGSMSMLRNSIRTKLFVLPEETAVFPGHGEETDIGYEKCFNPYG